MHQFGVNELTRESLLSNLAKIRIKDDKGVSRPAPPTPAAEQGTTVGDGGACTGRETGREYGTGDGNEVGRGARWGEGRRSGSRRKQLSRFLEQHSGGGASRKRGTGCCCGDSGEE